MFWSRKKTPVQPPALALSLMVLSAASEDGATKIADCPGHVQIFKHGLRSYRELPYRIAEFGTVHPYEPSGALHGLMRVRALTQDDAHIFCTEEQIADECPSSGRFRAYQSAAWALGADGAEIR